MKTISLLCCLAWLAGSAVSSLAADAPNPSPTPQKAGAATKLRHVVSFKFKDTATKDDIKKVEDAFRALKTKVPGIVSYEWGTNISPEKLNKGCTHCFILAFTSEADRDAYLVHPAHKAFGTLLGPFLADVFVIDFWAKD